jgi:hypothetical protein
VQNPDGVNQGIQQVWLDGKTLTDNNIPLLNDGKQHNVWVLLGPIMKE